MTKGAKSGSGIGRRKFLGGAVGIAMVAGRGGDPSAAAAGENTYAEKLSTPIVERHQVIVAGGGPSGVIAALAAARTGADTLLVERYPFLGGNGTAGLMTCYNGFRNQKPPEALQTVKGIPAEYIAELVRLGGIADMDNYPKADHDVGSGDLPYCIGFDPEAAKVAALNLLIKEGVRLRLHSWVVAPMLSVGRVNGVICESKSGRQAIAADIVVDATGDGDLAAWAGAPFMEPGRARRSPRPHGRQPDVSPGRRTGRTRQLRRYPDRRPRGKMGAGGRRRLPRRRKPHPVGGREPA
ncbi:MAG: FAD-dependent oxidoreductase [bacterium]|nr:FAD-dependent oxidoreductase [bacterium]